jgi:hypothetical protein
MRVVCILCGLFLVSLATPAVAEVASAAKILVIGGEGANCEQDPHCINRLHPAIPMTARASGPDDRDARAQRG